ncbi:MAG TPA: hypothetical protein VIG24_02005, partial [Acidimicrobiia bacterium]
MADRYKDMVVPVTLTGPDGTVTLNKRDTLGDRAKLVSAMRSVGVPSAQREAVIRHVAGEPGVALPDGVSVEIGGSEIVSQEIDASQYVRQTDKGFYGGYDLNDPADVQQLKDRGIEGSIYSENGVDNYVRFPDKIRTSTPPAKPDAKPDAEPSARLMRRNNDPDADPDADPSIDPDNLAPESDLAVETISFSQARQQMENTPLWDAIMVLRPFSNLQRSVQEAVSGVIFKAFDRIIGDVKIHVLEDTDFEMFYPEADAYYERKGDYIVIRASLAADPAAYAHAMLHEGAHAVFEQAVQQNEALADQVEYLLNAAAVHAADTGFSGSQYGFKNIHEFLAEAWSNPEFQEFLSGVPISKGERAALGIKGPETVQVKSAWNWIKARLTSLLGIKQALTSAGYSPGTRSILEAAMDIGGALMEKAPDARADPITSEGDSVLPMKRTKPAPDSLAGRLMSRGAPQTAAAEAAAVIESEFNGKATDAQLDALADALKENFATKAKENAAKVKAAKKYSRARAKAEIAAKKSQGKIGEIVKEDFVPGKNPGRPRLLKLTTNLQIAEIADRFFGRDSNPIRTIARAIEKRRMLKQQYTREMGPVVDKLAKAQKKSSRKDWEEFTSLVQDVTAAEVHPDRPLSENKHLGKNGLKGTWKRKQHAALAARYNALPPHLRELYTETRDTLTNAQNQMSLKLMENILKKVGIDDMSIAQRFHEDKATPDDRDLLGPELSAHIENATELKKVSGPYFNLARRGDFVVRGTHEITAPGNGRKIADDTIEFRSREAAVAYSEGMSLRNEVKSIWVDKATGERYGIEKDGTEVRISPNDASAEQRFRVVVQNRHVEFVDSMKEAKRTTAQLREAGLKVKDPEPKRYERQAPNAEMLSDQMRSLMATVDNRASMSGMSDGQKAELRATFNEVAL